MIYLCNNAYSFAHLERPTSTGITSTTATTTDSTTTTTGSNISNLPVPHGPPVLEQFLLCSEQSTDVVENFQSM